jgi:peptidoglycan hydrolase-like protein with peptidoglycan-binding domain
LVRGLDDGDYENYYPSVVRKVQNALQSQGLYSGPISGVLDEATMNAIGEYQRAENLQVVGVPTPRTRKALAIPPRDPQER